MTHRVALLSGAWLGLIGVAVGAFGAHALRPFLLQSGRLEVWQTAVQYQLVHAVALVGLAGWLRTAPQGAARSRAAKAAWLWTAGVILFSGSLYLLAAGAPRWVGPITPLGGLSLLAGWLFVALAALVPEP
jgi:uncharacterized membrane protein YgdD (TMEM256/DUF423 family)